MGLFNILKNKFSTSVEKTYTVEQIHNEIDTAEERICGSLDSFLESLNIVSNTKITRKASLLRELGFTKNETLKTVDTEILEKQKIEDQYSKLLEYKQTYPLNKILTIEEFHRICKKYNLIYATADNYIKDVPEKNLLEIKNSKKLLEQHLPEAIITLIGIRDLTLIKQLGKERPLFTQSEIIELCKKYYGYDVPHWTRNANNSSWLYVTDRGINGVADCNKYNYNSVEIKDKKGLHIAAPKTHFDLTGLSLDNEFGYAKVTKFEVLDPIAFEHLNKGFVRILSKWGTEDDQSYLDDALVNEFEN